ncbi:type II secretion system inner membrane protein GspF [Denitratisoma oestradiolicum]|uniref:Type II secretion system protein F n=1 Tax=Denitratisoma oestradiolicum TaxID=311182 RepID=A0A6S6XXS7_9PROT|nr:type II secretion system inner membrane protein GspF [Denitratisoma oestradiolicum]TWO79196.1 type II secretion system protein GspF [Denitratisoma oestradiolicum]CAB1370839.1 Type II secretion system protein F [Denitratisoma oestradiolicum]
MQAFRYKALDTAGHARQGTLEAENPRSAREALRQRSLTPLRLDAFNNSGSQGPARILSATLLADLTRQLAVLLDAGLTVEGALSVLMDQSDKPKVRERITNLRAEVLAGHSLAAALARYPRDFPPVYGALVRAGEQAGALPRVMSRLADDLERAAALRHQVLSASLYPALVSIVALAVVGALLAYVVPQVVAAFAHARQTLPLLTRALIATSSASRSLGPFLLLLLIVSGLAAPRFLAARPALAETLERRLLALPGLGRLLLALATSRIASTLGLLVDGGVPLVEALSIAARASRWRPLSQAVEQAARMVREGVPLSRALSETRTFPPVLSRLVESGEASGELPALLLRAAQQQESEARRRLSLLTALLEPALILTMGGVVLLIVIAIMLPVIEMNQLVH